MAAKMTREEATQERRRLIVQRADRLLRGWDVGGVGGLGFELPEELFDFLFVSLFHRCASALGWRPDHRFTVGL